jgi:hypothetical protein
MKSILKKCRVYSFVSDFMSISNTKSIYRCDLVIFITSYIRNNKLTIIVNGIKEVKLIDEFKIFIDNCIFIANKFRNKNITIEKTIKLKDLLFNYLNFCFISHNDIYIQNLIKIFKNILCEDIIFYISTYLIK